MEKVNGKAGPNVNLSYPDVGAAPAGHATDMSMHLTAAEKAKIGQTEIFTGSEKGKLGQTEIFTSALKSKLESTSILTSAEKGKLAGLAQGNYVDRHATASASFVRNGMSVSLLFNRIDRTVFCSGTITLNASKGSGIHSVLNLLSDLGSDFYNAGVRCFPVAEWQQGYGYLVNAYQLLFLNNNDMSLRLGDGAGSGNAYFVNAFWWA